MRNSQKGLAVLMTVLVLVLVSLLLRTYYVSSSNSLQRLEQVRVSALAVARDALIEYAVNYPSHYSDRGSGPGHLPCPDTNGNGSPAIVCGKLPMGLMPVDFEAGGKKNVTFYADQSIAKEPLWYVISSAFRYNPAPSGALGSSTIVNSDSKGELQLDEETGLIALIISPGPALPGQRREGNLSIEEYLEGENADGDAVFLTGEGNDTILPLRWRDLMPLVERRVLSTVKASLSDYQNTHGYLPWLARTTRDLQDSESVCSPCQWRGWLATERFHRNSPWPPIGQQTCFDDTRTVNQLPVELPAWFVSNFWHRYIWIQVAASEREGLCGRTENPVLDGTPVDAVLVSVGAALDNPQHGLVKQSHAVQGDLAHYLDSQLSIDGDSFFKTTPLSSKTNDQWSTLP